MLGLDSALESACERGERLLQSFNGESAGLNARPGAGRNRGKLGVAERSLIIAYLGYTMRPKVVRIPVNDIIRLSAGSAHQTGVSGRLADIQQRSALGGWNNKGPTVSAIELQSSQGSIIFSFSNGRHAGQLTHDAYVAIEQLIDRQNQNRPSPRPKSAPAAPAPRQLPADSPQVAYDIEEFLPSQVQDLCAILDRNAISYRIDRDELLVPEAEERVVDVLFERFCDAAGGQHR